MAEDRFVPGAAPIRYPDQNIKVLDPRFQKYVLGNAAIERIAGSCRFTEGPVWFGDGRYLLWSDIPNDCIMKWEEETGAVSHFRRGSHNANGNTRDRQGRLITCEMGSRRLARTEYDGTITVLAETFEGKQLTGPNDVVVKSDGSIWFSDNGAGIRGNYLGHKAVPELPYRVYRLDGRSGAMTIAVGDMERPNGLAFSPDERRLYVSETGDQTTEDPRQYIRMFELSLDGTRLSGGEIFHKIEPGYCDGLRVDEDGNLWSSAGDGVHCIDPGGHLLGKVLLPYRVSNLAFGGPLKNRLFVLASHTLYAVFLNRRGAQP